MFIAGLKEIFLKLLKNRDFLFSFKRQQKLSVYVYIVDNDITAVFLRNDLNLNQILSNKALLNIIIDYNGTAVYAVDNDLNNLAKYLPAQSMLKSYDSEPMKLKTKLLNKITIYNNEHTVAILKEIINSYLNL